MKAFLGDKPMSVLHLIRLVLKPRVVLFVIVLIYFLERLMSVGRDMDNPFIPVRWNFFRDSIDVPLVLLLSSIFILIRRLLTVALAVVMASRLVYSIGYLGLVGVSNVLQKPILSRDALRLWFHVTGSHLIVQTSLATVILVFGAVQLLLLWRRKRKRIIHV